MNSVEEYASYLEKEQVATAKSLLQCKIQKRHGSWTLMHISC